MLVINQLKEQRSSLRYTIANPTQSHQGHPLMPTLLSQVPDSGFMDLGLWSQFVVLVHAEGAQVLAGCATCGP